MRRLVGELFISGALVPHSENLTNVLQAFLCKSLVGNLPLGNGFVRDLGLVGRSESS